MELSDYLKIARAHWRAIVAFALLGLCAASLLSLLSTPRYTAQTSILFAVQSASSAGDLAQGSTYAEKQVQSFAEVATAPVVLQPVIDELNLDMTSADLAGRVTATVPQKTVIVRITVTDPDPAQSAAIANAVGHELTQASQNLTPQTPTGQSAVQATVIAPALTPERPTSPRVAQNLAAGLLLGLALGYGVSLLREQLDTRLRNSGDIAQVTEIPVVASVPLDSHPETPLVLESDPLGHRAEAYRRLSTTLQFVNVDHGPRALLVTSSMPAEGKSTTTINLAMSLAEANQRVLLIDADLRRPRVGESFAMDSSVGLTTVLIGRADLEDVVQPYGQEGNLHVLPAGTIPPNPGELLGSRRMQALLARAAEEYDTVLLDCPPVLPVADAGVLARLTGGVIVVVGAGQTHRAQLTQTLDSLEKSGGHVAGIVVNRIKRTADGGYTY
ncbi:MAG: polysaccharide biosynthesis tyrosine autokinase, partial [Propionibacteriaceae bacterium]|nr:polysaccharide biosynthesis tyrosine autokinase [Propionibacteriaceae bacterium]